MNLGFSSLDIVRPQLSFCPDLAPTLGGTGYSLRGTPGFITFVPNVGTHTPVASPSGAISIIHSADRPQYKKARGPDQDTLVDLLRQPKTQHKARGKR